MTALSDKLSDLKPRPSGVPCSVRVLLDQLDDEDREALQKVLADHSITSVDIYRALTDAGHYVGAQTVARHRAGRCRCAGSLAMRRGRGGIRALSA